MENWKNTITRRVVNKYFKKGEFTIILFPLSLFSFSFLANLFLGFHEETWLNNFNHSNHPLLYRRYVDDTFCVFHNEQDAISF